MSDLIKKIATTKKNQYSLDQERKRLFTALAVIITLVSNFVFAGLDLVQGRFLMSGVGATEGLLLVGGIILLRRKPKGLYLYRVLMGIIILILFDSFLLGTAKHPEILWFFVFPLGAFYLVGRKEGAIWMMMLFGFSTLLLAFPQVLNSPKYPSSFSFRFITSFSLFTMFAFGMEALRNYYTSKTINKTKELQDALNNIKTLRGLLPICSTCKMIRNDDGYWSKLEDYITEHTDTDFTHGICDECLKKQFPIIFEEMKNEGYLKKSTDEKSGKIQNIDVQSEGDNIITSSDVTRKMYFVYFALIPTTFVILFYSLYYYIINFMEASLAYLVIGILMPGAIYLIKNSPNRVIIYRVLAVLTSLAAIFPQFFHPSDPSEILWLFAIPPATFYILGKKEGSYWIIPGIVFAITCFAAPSLVNNYKYPSSFSMIFLISYFMVIYLSYYLESLRERFEKEMNEKTQAVADALKRVKTVAGLIPICATCKKIKDDQGYWKDVEEYIINHSEAELSNTKCNNCCS
jgi:hypothetical protein